MCAAIETMVLEIEHVNKSHRNYLEAREYKSMGRSTYSLFMTSHISSNQTLLVALVLGHGSNDRVKVTDFHYGHSSTFLALPPLLYSISKDYV